MIYARGTGDGIAWNGGERGTGGRQKGDWGGELEGDWRETGGGTGERLEGDWRGIRKREENLNH